VQQFFEISFVSPGGWQVPANFCLCECSGRVLGSCGFDIGAITKERDFTDIALQKYKAWLSEGVPDSMPIVVIFQLKVSGSFAGVDPLMFWKEIAGDRTNANKFGGSFLLPVASMVLALPAGESVDEFTFSSTQRTLTASRNSLSPTHLEQITVVRMFIRNFGWSPQDPAVWLGERERNMTKRRVRRRRSECK
jgi:hypothetical protein